MPEPIPYADDATAYVLGTLGARERRRFEGRLKRSSELQKVVRVLEMGSIGLALAAPRREPPAKLWEGIQAAVTHECEKQNRAAGRAWLRSAVGIAACAVVGWLAYTLWHPRALSSSPSLAGGRAAAGSATNSAAPALARAVSQTPAASNLASNPPRERRARRPSESATLRERVGDLENQVAHLEQTVMQQQALPADFNRLTFLSIGPEGANGTTSGQIIAPSPELQRALLLGVARQLGWMPPSPASPSSVPPPPAPTPLNPNPPAAQNEPSVEFVDLPPVDPPSSESQTASLQTQSSSPAATSEASGLQSAASIPGFVSGTNLVFAINSSVVPAGTETVSFFSGYAGSAPVFRGSVPLGSGATVVTMPFFQLRAWDNSGLSQASPGTVTFSYTSGGPAASLRLIVSDPPPGSP
jgi:hypothetical protein